MTDEEKLAPIIIIRKKAAHAGHHGGAWKVAYADFVTAMMALFIVLWLMASSQKIQQSVAGYFGDPKGNGKQTGTSKAGSTSKAKPVTKPKPVTKSKPKRSARRTACGLPPREAIK